VALGRWVKDFISLYTSTEKCNEGLRNIMR
jgi:hypothetical protein